MGQKQLISCFFNGKPNEKMVRFSRNSHNLMQLHKIEITYSMKIGLCLLNKMIIVSFANQCFRSYIKPGFL